VNIGIIGHDHFLPLHLKFVIDQSCQYSTVYIIWDCQRHQLNHERHKNYMKPKGTWANPSIISGLLTITFSGLPREICWVER
jgi:hypothetical protein